MIQIHSGETSRPLATSLLVRSRRDLIKARFARSLTLDTTRSVIEGLMRATRSMIEGLMRGRLGASLLKFGMA